MRLKLIFRIAWTIENEYCFCKNWFSFCRVSTVIYGETTKPNCSEIKCEFFCETSLLNEDANLKVAFLSCAQRGSAEVAATTLTKGTGTTQSWNSNCLRQYLYICGFPRTAGSSQIWLWLQTCYLQGIRQTTDDFSLTTWRSCIWMSNLWRVLILRIILMRAELKLDYFAFLSVILDSLVADVYSSLLMIESLAISPEHWSDYDKLLPNCCRFVLLIQPTFGSASKKTKAKLKIPVVFQNDSEEDS